MCSVQLRLGDMELVIEVERDFTSYGDECKFGGGKVSCSILCPTLSIHAGTEKHLDIS